jgi:hypothetical protein
MLLVVSALSGQLNFRIGLICLFTALVPVLTDRWRNDEDFQQAKAIHFALPAYRLPACNLQDESDDVDDIHIVHTYTCHFQTSCCVVQMKNYAHVTANVRTNGPVPTNWPQIGFVHENFVSC